MRIVKTQKIVKEVEVPIEDYRLCDKCDNRITYRNFDAFEFKFELKTGSSYPECGFGEISELDLCQECSKELVELLVNKGYKVQTREWDW